MNNPANGNRFEPAYLALLRRGELAARIESAYRHLEDCDLCARYCRINRRQTRDGAVCRTGERAVVNGFGPHHGEEDPLRGWNGSGTIFFSWCNLRCVFCQNWEISQKGMGREVEPEELADMMLALQSQGCNNINLVTPSHVVARSSPPCTSPRSKVCACRWSTTPAATTAAKRWRCSTASSISTCRT